MSVSSSAIAGTRDPTPACAPFLGFWGKARDGSNGDADWHPIAYHCLDVAACVQRIFSVRPLARRAAARLLRVDEVAASGLLTALAALHDIGKFATAFQAKRPDLWPAALGPMPADVPTTYHTRDGLCLWDAVLRSRVGPRLWQGDLITLRPAVQAIMGHHGRPVSVDPVRDVVSLVFLPDAREAATAFADRVTSLLSPAPTRGEHLDESDVLRATWWIAGLTTTADWVGSNEDWFPYHTPIVGDDDLGNYWDIARQRANIAVASAGLEPPRAATRRSFAELTGRGELTPAQRWASDVPLPDGPTLFLLEDTTGAGKTEAAQVLIHRLMASGRATGAFWAMPTQATANAMYDRQRSAILALFDDESMTRPSLVLAHGQSRLHEGFRATVIRQPNQDARTANADAIDAPGEITCAAFLASSSRVAFMADLGAGTVDQAILSVLPSKFNTMRLFGLAEKVLVLDEIHAYDAYMIEELKTLLRFHAALGGHAIALSATLSSRLSSAFIDEWRWAALGPRRRPATAVARDYPLATVVQVGGACSQTPIEPASWSSRSTPVRLIHDEHEVIDRLLAASRGGAAAVWIRNTVDSCREGATILRARGAQRVSVFHARFAQCDRQCREREVLRRYGPGDGAGRAGSILVATQVVEQSLDLDFDVMVTDLAPIDLLIQRSGRLHRHALRKGRPSGARPELLVLAPEFRADPAADWLDHLLPKTKWVYEDAGVLWRTLRALESEGAIVVPAGVRSLVEEVYDNADCPPGLQGSADRAQGRSSAAIGTARQYVLNLLEGFVGESLIWASDVRVPTRIEDHQVTIRLGRVFEDSVVAWAEGAGLPDWHRWALSEVRVSRRRFPADGVIAGPRRQAGDRARATWGRWEQGIPLVPLESERDCWVGCVASPSGHVTEVRYDLDVGLTLANVDSPP